MRGNFTSPDYPQHYAHDLDCSWTITVSAGYYIYLHFEHFHLEDGGSHCPYDYVQIFDGSLASNPITTKRCAYQDSWCVYSRSNVLKVILITDGSVSHPGFSAYYERVYQSYPNCSLVSTSKVVNFLYDCYFTFFVVVSVSSYLFDGALYVDLEFLIKAKLSVFLEISLVMPMT